MTLRAAWLIFLKDLRMEFRAKDIFTAMMYFSMLVIIIFNFALDLREVSMDAVAPGILWVAFCFAGVLGLNRAFLREQERGALEGLLLAPIDRSAIYLGKFLGNAALMLLVELLVVPMFVIMFNLRGIGFALFPALLLGTIGFAAVGTLFSAMAVNTRAREILLPVLLFPILVPIVISAVKATQVGIALQSFDLAVPWLNLMVAFDLIFLAVSYVVFEHVVVE